MIKLDFVNGLHACTLSLHFILKVSAKNLKFFVVKLYI